ncbi:MAG: metal-dependent transcriptional regulator [Methanimicrococcus sp.]|nr:metal-dependent transcriptional regulator [Methanimicrococcus sp.]
MPDNNLKLYQPTGLELSPRKVSYLKYLLERKETVRTSEISEVFDVDPSTVTKLIAELSADGYLDHAPYRGVRLTDKGKEYAEFCIKRHQILCLVFSHYGLPPKTSCTEVSRFESFVSKEAIDMIYCAMGHPTMSSCVTAGEIKQNNTDPCTHNRLQKL